MQKRLLIIGGIVFFISTSWLYLSTPTVFNSPDEAANAAVIRQFADGKGLWLPAAVADTQDIRNLVHPRSMQVVGGRLVPAGFLGLPALYGVIALVTHSRVIDVLTPLAALGGLVALYFLVLRGWNDRRIAAWSVALLALHPAFWYYTTRGLFHNVLFVSLLLISFSVILRPRFVGAEESHTNQMRSFGPLALRMTIAIVFLWLAILVRPSELWWVLALVLLYLWWQRSVMTKKQIMSWLLLGGGLALITVALYRYVYGDVSFVAVAAQYGGGTEGMAAQAWWRWFLPFGFHPRVMLWSVVRWYGLLALPFTLLTLGGLALVFRTRMENARRWAWLFLGITLWLFIVYGSWLIFDNPSRDVTIGGAYLRYWLPSFVLGAPFGAYAIVWCMDKLSNKWRIIGGATAVLVLVAFTMYVAVIRTDGVRDVKQASEMGERIREALKTHDGGIPANSIILTDREDKFLVDEWQVIQPVKNHDNLRAVYELLNEGKSVFFVTPARSIDEWRDLKEGWFGQARLMYTYWFSVGEIEVHALKRVYE